MATTTRTPAGLEDHDINPHEPAQHLYGDPGYANLSTKVFFYNIFDVFKRSLDGWG